MLSEEIDYKAGTMVLKASSNLRRRSYKMHKKLAVIRSRMRCTRGARRESAKAPVGVGLRAWRLFA